MIDTMAEMAILNPKLLKLEKPAGSRLTRENTTVAKTKVVASWRKQRDRTIVQDISGKKVKSLHTDISTISGERVIIFISDSPLFHD